MSRLATRLRDANPLPEGTLSVGAGLVINGLCIFAFTSLTTRLLGEDLYAPLAVLWVSVIIAGPGFFLPIEQEVSRALAHRRAIGRGTGTLIRQAALLGLVIAGVLLVVCLLAGPYLIEHLFDDQVLVWVGLLIGILGYYPAHVLRGALSGQGRFGGYARYLAAEGLSRVLLAGVLAIVGVRTAGPFGIVVGLAPLVASFVAVRGERNLVTPGPPAPWSELTQSIGSLLAGSVFTGILLNGGVIAVELLATDAEKDRVAQFLPGLLIARVPLFLFQAVQASLLPKLALLAGSGNLVQFRRALQRLLVAVGGIGVLAVVASAVVGPFALKLLSGEEFELPRQDLALLAASSALFMLATAVAQALIAVSGPGRMAIGWFLGVVAFVVVTLLGDDLYLRVEIGLIVGTAVTFGVLAALLHLRLAESHRWEAPVQDTSAKH